MNRARRQLLLGAGALCSAPAWAQFRVEISGVGATQLPIAIARFRDEQRSNVSLSGIVRADLERSGVFRVPDTAEAVDESAQPDFLEWRARTVDALVGGSVTRLADGRYDIRYKLWDVVRGNALGGQSIVVPQADLRLAAHQIADFIYQKLTGEQGVFSTRIAYVSKAGNRYTLRVADADGENSQVALSSPEPIISPTWSPEGRELAYVSFESQKAVIWSQDVFGGQRRTVANFKGSNSAPAWAPDGSLVATLTLDGNSQLYAIGRNGGTPRRLYSSVGIDTEPVVGRDGRIYFVSDRGGGPQIYRGSLSGGGVERVTFSGSYNISPTISPDGRTLAYITRSDGGFRVAVMDLASGSVQTITDTADDESPSFAPNGRLLIYATRLQGRDVLMTTTLDGRIKARLLTSLADVREPAWGPFGR